MSPTEADSSPPSRRLPIVPVLLILLLIGFALFGEKGILRALQAKRQKTALLEEIRRLEATNSELRKEIDALHSDRRYIEAVARKELGMVKDDELVYQFPSARDASKARTADEPGASRPEQ